jgi:hypothetical protein
LLPIDACSKILISRDKEKGTLTTEHMGVPRPSVGSRAIARRRRRATEPPAASRPIRVTAAHAEQAARASAHVRPWSALRARRRSPGEPPLPQSAGWSDGGNRHVLPQSHAEAHPRLQMRQGAAAARPRQPGQGRVLHCVPAQASKLAWVPRADARREGAHDGGEMGLRRSAKE